MVAFHLLDQHYPTIDILWELAYFLYLTASLTCSCWYHFEPHTLLSFKFLLETFHDTDVKFIIDVDELTEKHCKFNPCALKDFLMRSKTRIRAYCYDSISLTHDRLHKKKALRSLLLIHFCYYCYYYYYYYYFYYYYY